MDAAFAAGHVVCERLLIPAIAQTFYKPQLLKIVDALLAAPVLGHAANPASGHADVLGGSAGGDGEGPLFPVSSSMPGGAGGIMDNDLFVPEPPRVTLSSVAVPEPFVDRPFMFLFAHFARAAMLPVALHRSRRVRCTPCLCALPVFDCNAVLY